MRIFTSRLSALVATVAVFVALGANVDASQLKVGTAVGDLTPSKSVPLWGQFEYRPSQGADTPITCNAIAVAAYDEDKLVDSAILVSVDVVHVPSRFARLVREKVVAEDASINPEKIVMFAIHSHTAPTLEPQAELPTDGSVEPYEDTIQDLSGRLAKTIVKAWQNQVPADFSWGIDPIVLGESRRAVYFDGTAKMYGETNTPNFSHYENPIDPDMSSLYFWNKEGDLIGLFINVACTAQIVEHLSTLNADFWAPTRAKLQERFGKQLVVVGTNGAAGDNSPHPMYRREALARMRALRGQTELEAAAWKIDKAIADTYAAVVKDKQSDVKLSHVFETLPLEMREVTDEEYEQAKIESQKVVDALNANPNKSQAEVAFMGTGWHGNVVKRYEDQHKNGIGTYPSFVHVIRLGDVAIATNQFELFTAYGMRIKARSPAVATVVVELADGDGCYLPTAEAIAGGGYSAVIQSDFVSPAGGQQLVEETLRILNDLWK